MYTQATCVLHEDKLWNFLVTVLAEKVGSASLLKTEERDQGYHGRSHPSVVLRLFSLSFRVHTHRIVVPFFRVFTQSEYERVWWRDAQTAEVGFLDIE